MKREHDILKDDKLLFYAPLSTDTQDKVSGQYGVVGTKASVTLDSNRRMYLIKPTSYYSSTTFDTTQTGLIFDISHLNIADGQPITILQRIEPSKFCEYSSGSDFRSFRIYSSSNAEIHSPGGATCNQLKIQNVYKIGGIIPNKRGEYCRDYFNGNIILHGGAMSSIGYLKTLSIGATVDGRGSHHSEGYVGDFRIYDGILTAEEIETIWLRGY